MEIDLIVTDAYTLGGAILAKKLQVPCYVNSPVMIGATLNPTQHVSLFELFYGASKLPLKRSHSFQNPLWASRDGLKTLASISAPI